MNNNKSSLRLELYAFINLLRSELNNQFEMLKTFRGGTDRERAEIIEKYRRSVSTTIYCCESMESILVRMCNIQDKRMFIGNTKTYCTMKDFKGTLSDLLITNGYIQDVIKRKERIILTDLFNLLSQYRLLLSIHLWQLTVVEGEIKKRADRQEKAGVRINIKLNNIQLMKDLTA